MRNIMLIAENIIRLLFRKKNSIIIYIILPVIGILVPLIMFANGNGSFVRVGVVNKDPGFLSGGIYEELNQQKRFKVSVIAEDEVNTAISGGKLECALIIPEGFTKSYLTGDPSSIEVVSVQGIAATGWLESFLNTSLPQIDLLAKASDGDETTFKNLYNEYVEADTSVALKSVENQATGLSITYLGIGFLIQFILLGAQRTVSLIIRERKEKTLARICCAPVKNYEFITGNVVVNVCLVTLQTLASLLIMHYILNINMGADPLTIMIILFPLLIASVGATLMLVSFAKNEGQLNILSTLFIYPTCLISGCFWDVKLMPEFMQKLSHLFPQRWALDAIESVMSGNTLKDVSMNLLVISAFALAFFAAAVYGFNKKNAALA